MVSIMQEFHDERHLWGLAGTQELLSLEQNINKI
jgi:hypothetical protein